ncbi:MAG TPA: thioredoxin domain-containing protein [Rhodanobacteraceae bacterium]|nr:thioredoxin domain-containing protein [Rhodanobacteraceae bacterium]
MKARRYLAVALLEVGLLLTAACSAQNDTDGASVSAPAATKSATASSSFTEGKQYVRLAQAGEKAAGPVVIVEVFSYACPHCAEFAPIFTQLRGKLPKGVQVRYLPAVFSESWEPYARAFYAARQLGVLQSTHDALFKAMEEHYPLNSLEDLADFYASHGVDRQKFLDAARSPQTDAQMAANQKIEQGWGINATPTLVVGRLQDDSPGAAVVADYRSNEVAGYQELAQVGEWLVQKEVRASKQ